MLGLAVLLLIVAAILSLFGAAVGLLFKVGIVLLVVGIAVDVLTGFSAYGRFRR